MQAHFPSEHLAVVALLNHFNTILEDSRPEITGSQNILVIQGGHLSLKVTLIQ
jgi:hypothetical protein